MEKARTDLLGHPVYAAVHSIARLRVFMQHHIWAVWSFMSLAKRLQRELTCIDLPWLPPKATDLTRFINEIILGEESDRMLDSTYKSHFDLYVSAMQEIGANPEPALGFIAALRNGSHFETVLESSIPAAVAEFVNFDVQLARHGSLAEVCGSFLWGREDLIPDMFRRIIPTLHENQLKAPHFEFYVQRHIEVDGTEHGPLAHRLLESVCKSPQDHTSARQAGIDALGLRKRLWDAICFQLI